MFEKMTRAIPAAIALVVVAGNVQAQTQTLDNTVDRSCVATEDVKQKIRLAALPPSAVPGYSRASAALRRQKDEVFLDSGRIEKRRTDAAWKTAHEVLKARPSLRQRIEKAVLHDNPRLRRRDHASQDDLDRLFYEYARVDPRLLSLINRRLYKDVKYDALLADTLKAGDRIDELEGRQIRFNEAIPVHWDAQEKAALRAARAFAAKSKMAKSLVDSSRKNSAIRQALFVAAALDAQTNGSLPEDYRSVQAESVIIKGAVVGLPMPETRSLIREVDSIIRQGELRITHVDKKKLGSARERAAMQTNPARRLARLASQKIVGTGLQEVHLGHVLSREMRKATIPPLPDLRALPPTERIQKARQFVQGMKDSLEQKATELKKLFFLE